MFTVPVFRSAVRTFSWLSLVLLIVAPVLRAQSAADAFDPNVDGTVYAVAVQADGKILIGGEFDSAKPNGARAKIAVKNVARFNIDGTLDESFKPKVNGRVQAIAVQGDGKILIGGKFTKVGSKARGYVARLNASGSLDNAFNPNAGGGLVPDVRAILVQQDGKIVIGGGFTTVQPGGSGKPVTRNRLARFTASGALDKSFDPNFGGLVLSLAQQADGKLLVGGGFTTVQPNGRSSAITRHRLARLNLSGTVDTSFNLKANNAVNAIAVQPDQRIIIAGSFTSLDPASGSAVTRPRMARVNTDGSLDTTFLAAPDALVSAVAVQGDGRIVLAGRFSSIAGAGGAVRPYAARLLPTGAVDPDFNPTFNYYVNALALQADGGVIFGGGFTATVDRAEKRVSRSYVARVLRTGGLDTNLDPTATGRASAVAVQSDGKILLGGDFSSVGGKSHSGIARLSKSGGVDASFEGSTNGRVFTIAQQADGKVLIGGSFTVVNNVVRGYIARLNADGSLDTAFDPNTNGTVSSIVVQPDKKILVGGSFTVLRPNGASATVTRRYIMRLKEDGTVDEDFNPNADGAVHAIALRSDGTMFIGGDFTLVQPNGDRGAYRYGLALLKASGELVSEFDAGVAGSVSALAIQGEKIIVGGFFQQVADRNAAHVRESIARFGFDGLLDEDFKARFNARVSSIVVQSDNKIVVGGVFTTVGVHGSSGSTLTRRYVARLNSDGAPDTSFNLGLDSRSGNLVMALARQSDNKILVAGTFSSLKPSGASASVKRSRIARITEAGGLDSGFNADVGGVAPPTVHALAQQGDGRVLVAGGFDDFNGADSKNLARFYSDSSPDAIFFPQPNGPVRSLAVLPSSAPVATQHEGLAAFDSNGALVEGFVPAAIDRMTGTVSRIYPLSNGKFLVAGRFTVDGGDLSLALARFNADGTRDTTFTPLFDGAVYTVAFQKDGKLLVGGAFKKLAGKDRPYIARISGTDGALDENFKPTLNDVVYAILPKGDAEAEIYVGGAFTRITEDGESDPTTRNYLALLTKDGKVVEDYNPNPNGFVLNILPASGDKILVSGGFGGFRPESADKTLEQQFLARLNAEGTLDTAFKPEIDGSVISVLDVGDGELVIGGNFQRIGSTRHPYIARLKASGALDSAFKLVANGQVLTLATASNNRLLVGGAFSALRYADDESTVIVRNRIARVNATSGRVDAAFNPDLDSTVSSVAITNNGVVLAGGSFTAVQSVAAIVIGGSFSDIAGAPVNNFALLSSSGGLNSSFLPNPNGEVRALAVTSSNQILVAGSFTKMAGSTRNRIARMNSSRSLDTTFNPNANNTVSALALQADGKILAGGSFTKIGGASRSYLARLNTNGTADTSFNASVSRAVTRLAVQPDGKIIYAAGSGKNATLGRLNANGSNDSSFSATVNGAVDAIVVQSDGKILIGGSFTKVGSTTRNYVARLKANGSLDTSFKQSPNGPVTAILLSPDGKVLLGGSFTKIGKVARYGIARLSGDAVAAETFKVNNERTVMSWTPSGPMPTPAQVVFESSTDGGDEWSSVGTAKRVGSTGTWQLTGLALPSKTNLLYRVRAVMPAGAGSSSWLYTSAHQFYLPAVPVVTGATSVAAQRGAEFLYAVPATDSPTRYTAKGLPPGLTIDSATGIISGKPTKSGTYTVTVTVRNSTGTSTGKVKISVKSSAVATTKSSRLLRTSNLTYVSSGRPAYLYFKVSGKKPQTLLLRAVGPGLKELGVSNRLPQPKMELTRGSTLLASEQAWGGNANLRSLFQRVGASPLSKGSKDAAILVTLKPGSYRLRVTGAGSDKSGNVLLEVYDTAVKSPFAKDASKLSSQKMRSHSVESGKPVVAGFEIKGSGSKTLLIRGLGPKLGSKGVKDPWLGVYNKNGTLLAKNRDWEKPETVRSSYPAASASKIKSATKKVGASALSSSLIDTAVLIKLKPGVYTVQGRGTKKGRLVVEIYEVP